MELRLCFGGSAIGEEEEEEEEAAARLSHSRLRQLVHRPLRAYHYENRYAVTFCAGETGYVLLLLEPNCSLFYLTVRY